MRLRLRPGLHYAPVRAGVYLSTPSMHFVIRGPDTLYPLLDELVPLLEDGATEEEAAARTATPRLARNVIAAMRGKDLFLDLDQMTVPEPDLAVRRQYAGALTELEMTSPDPYAAFARLRASRVLLAGPATVVLPAARGLLRAGATRLLLALPDPADGRPLASRSPGVTVTALADGKIATEVGYVAAALFAAADTGLLDLQRAELPPGCPTVPLLTGGPLCIAGPPVRGEPDAGAWPALCARASRWQRDGQREPVALPAGAALCGALAGQTIFRLLTGIRSDGEAHVVYGGALAADVIHLAPALPEEDRAVDLTAVAADTAPPLSDTLTAVHAASSQWTGMFRIITPEDLPQLPVALLTAEQRCGADGEVLAWGADQEQATCLAGLACLRDQAAATDPRPGTRPGRPAPRRPAGYLTARSA